ncbi:MAG: universal stress protein [Hyphomicrobiaceae bacterium]|nr:universal stress protein [Hyphomicrobiaceae bacterium]
MYRHIMIATDGSDVAQRAVDQGLRLAMRLGSKATVVTVSEPYPAELAPAWPIEDYDRAVSEKAQDILGLARDAAAALGASCDYLHVKDAHPAEGIIQAAADQNCDLIAMASHGRRGFQRMILGSQAYEVIVKSPIPVLICR